MRWYLLAAEAGDPVAQLNPSVMVAPAQADFAAGLAAYDAGNFNEAFVEWWPLAENGDSAAQIAIAELYRTGKGVRADVAARPAFRRVGLVTPPHRQPG